MSDFFGPREMTSVSGEYNRRILDNGLCVIGVQNPTLHYFVCNVRAHAGFRFETAQDAGLTHFLEHMLHQGSRSFPTSSAISRAVEDLGGIIDGETQPEALEMSVGVHRKHWRKALAVLTDILLNPLFEQEAIEREKRVVAQEIAEYRGEQQRNISAAELAYSLLFHEQFSELGLRGSLELLNRFSGRLVREQYERFFIPENMVVSVAGAFEFDAVLEELSGSLGQMPAGRPLPRVVGVPARRRRRAIYRLTQRLPVFEVELACHACALRDERFPAVQAAAHILGGGLSSRLFTQVRERQGLVYHIASLAEGYSDAGSLVTLFNVDARSLPEALSATLDAVGELVEGGVEPEELERHKETVRCGMEIMCDRPQRLADWFGRQELLLRPEPLMTPAAYVAKHVALTQAELSRVLSEFLAEGGSNLAVVGPFSEAQQERLRRLFPAEEIGGGPCAAADGEATGSLTPGS